MAEETSFAESLTSQEGQADLARTLTDYTLRNLPAEKLRLQAELDRTAQEIKGLTSNYADGRGQAVASIPLGLYLRWEQEVPGCWNDPNFKREFLSDNRACLLPGYKVKAKTVIFDMSHRPGIAPGVRLYWQNKDRVTGVS